MDVRFNSARGISVEFYSVPSDKVDSFILLSKELLGLEPSVQEPSVQEPIVEPSVQEPIVEPSVQEPIVSETQVEEFESLKEYVFEQGRTLIPLMDARREIDALQEDYGYLKETVANLVKEIIQLKEANARLEEELKKKPARTPRAKKEPPLISKYTHYGQAFADAKGITAKKDLFKADIASQLMMLKELLEEKKDHPDIKKELVVLKGRTKRDIQKALFWLMRTYEFEPEGEFRKLMEEAIAYEPFEHMTVERVAEWSIIKYLSKIYEESPRMERFRKDIAKEEEEGVEIDCYKKDILDRDKYLGVKKGVVLRIVEDKWKWADFKKNWAIYALAMTIENEDWMELYNKYSEELEEKFGDEMRKEIWNLAYFIGYIDYLI